VTRFRDYSKVHHRLRNIDVQLGERPNLEELAKPLKLPFGIEIEF
jgi:hypothetical protein